MEYIARDAANVVTFFLNLLRRVCLLFLFRGLRLRLRLTLDLLNLDRKDCLRGDECSSF